jgi:alginate O-acetyltransferase complex protein AlgI
MFGIRLPVNFRSPYQALSIIEFWRRWHITLSRFLRDYLYIPLGGNRRGPARRYVNLLLTMLLGGLWHGAGWNFPIWGALHGVYLVVNHVWRARVLILPRLASWCLTFVAVVLAWVFFRAETLGGALRVLSAMAGVAQDGKPFESDGAVRVLGLPVFVGVDAALAAGLALVAVTLLITVALPNVPRIFSYREYRRAPEPRAALSWQPTVVWALALALAFVLALFGMWQRLEFLYFQF